MVTQTWPGGSNVHDGQAGKIGFQPPAPVLSLAKHTLPESAVRTMMVFDASSAPSGMRWVVISYSVTCLAGKKSSEVLAVSGSPRPA